ncbi:MAG: CBS domain-containing protein [Candidatus Roizmanbacteria bacterium]|nr:CBS domain-containing protein [Candidatus Roizmanbacteria bacterium]
MKVHEFMQKDPVALKPESTVREAVRLFYNLGISSVLVEKDKKLYGILTEQDILQNMFPSIQDFVESFVSSSRADIFSENLQELLGQQIEKYVETSVKSISENMPLMRAQSLMLVNRFSHLPVVNDSNEIVGVISKGDIFRALVGSEIPYDNEEEYHDWLAYHFDLVQNKRKKYSIESESIAKLIGLEKKTRILDIGCGTGGHDIALVEKGYTVVGLDKSLRMHKESIQKWNKLSQLRKDKLTLIKGSTYKTMLVEQKGLFNAVIFLGNALAHNPENYKENLKYAAKALDVGGKVILQLVNFEKVLTTQRRLQDFNITGSRFSKNREYLFIEFYDPSRTNKNLLTLNMAVLKTNGRRWMQSSINSTPIAYITKESITALLNSIGLTSIKHFGSNHGEPLFDQPFDIHKHDWLTVVATKK